MNFCPCGHLLFPLNLLAWLFVKQPPGLTQCLKHDVELQLELRSQRRPAMAAPRRGSRRGTPRGPGGRPTPAGEPRRHVRAPHAGARSGVFTPLPNPGQARPGSRIPGSAASRPPEPELQPPPRQSGRGRGGEVSGRGQAAAAAARRMRGASPVSGSGARGAGAGGACVWASRRRV